MRVIAGRLRGRRIDAPDGDTARPTYDRVRASVFDILGPRVEGARVLDLFAGSGALGIECLSRGAASATFVERDRRVLGALRRNLAALGLSAPAAAVVAGDALRAVGRGVPGGPFDVVFVDPPYGSGLSAAALEALAAGAGVLAPGAVVVVEHAKGDAPEPRAGTVVRTRGELYGSTEVTFFEVREAGGREAP